jgi:cytochrome c biogenesis protein
MKSLKVGETLNYSEGSITLAGWKPWVNIEVGRDPGKMIALFGALFAVVGLLASLFIGRRKEEI